VNRSYLKISTKDLILPFNQPYAELHLVLTRTFSSKVATNRKREKSYDLRQSVTESVNTNGT